MADDYGLMPVEHDPFEDMHGTPPTGNVAASVADVARDVGQRAVDWWRSQPSWSDQMHQAMQSGDLESKINLLGGFTGSTMGGRPTTISAMRHNPFHPTPELAAQIKQAMNDSPHTYFGLRVDDGVRFSPGEQIPNSRRWINGEPTDSTVNGVSTRGLGDEASLEQITQALHDVGPYVGDHLSLVGGRRSIPGEDNLERIISPGNVVWNVTAPRSSGGGGGGVTGGNGPPGIRAYHGSPHDFDAFDLAKIGTGEGAQAYGHGLYFAENPETAKSYRDKLSADRNIKIGQDALQNPGMNAGATRQAYYSLRSAGGDIDAAIKNAGGATNPEEVQSVLRAWKAIGVSKDPGKMYEVNINADPEHFLDWDKPLSEQHPKVQKFWNRQFQHTDISPFERRDIPASEGGFVPQNVTGSQIYHNAMRRPNPDFDSSDPLGATHILSEAGASQALRDAGIPGIKYLDQGSRGAGQGTSNYVVFDAKLIDISRKYGMAGLIAGGAAHFGLQPVDGDPFAAGN